MSKDNLFVAEKNFYENFMKENEALIRDNLKNSTMHQCIILLHRYASRLHKGIILSDLTQIEAAYHSMQTILEIYYEKLGNKKAADYEG